MRDLKNGLSKYIVRVEAGEEVIVTDRGRPVDGADRAELIWRDPIGPLARCGEIDAADMGDLAVMVQCWWQDQGDGT